MKEKKTILIYADGNPDIATGHLMRCLSIAHAIKSLGGEVQFAVSDEASAGLLSSFFTQESRFAIHTLHADYRKPETGLPGLKRLLTEEDSSPDGSFSCLLIDSYFVTQPFLEALRPLTRIALLDDLYAFDYPADLVINYDFAPPEDFYSKAGTTLLGSAYTPLRAQFSGLTPALRSPVRDILLSTGGTDGENVAGKLAEALLTVPESASFRIHVLVGAMYAHRAKLEALAQTQPRLLLHERVTDMAALMCACDLAVSAAGTTLYELCAAGVPSVSFTMADNQLAVARDMERFAGVPYAGDVRSTPALTDRLASLLFSLAREPEKRKALSRSMHAAVDGKGAQRIARRLLTL